MGLQTTEGNCTSPLLFSLLDYYIFHLFSKFAVQSKHLVLKVENLSRSHLQKTAWEDFLSNVVNSIYRIKA